MRKRGLCRRAVSVRLSVSVTFVYSVETTKHIFNFFSPSGTHTSLVFPYQTSWQYSDGDPPNKGVECRCRWQKLRLSTNIWLHRVLSILRLLAGDDDKVFMTRRFNVTPKTTEQNLIVSSGAVRLRKTRVVGLCAEWHLSFGCARLE